MVLRVLLEKSMAHMKLRIEIGTSPIYGEPNHVWMTDDATGNIVQ